MGVYRGSLCPSGGVLRILRSIQSVLDPCWLLLPGRVTVGCARSIWPLGRSGTIAPVSKSSLMLSLCSNIEALLSCHCLLEDNCLRYHGALPACWEQADETKNMRACVFDLLPRFHSSRMYMLTMVWACPESCSFLWAMLSE